MVIGNDDHGKFDGTLTEFLAGRLTGSVNCPAFPTSLQDNLEPRVWFAK